MKCFACEYDNPEGAKFCLNCGKPQTMACHNCGAQLPRSARFCFNCGAAQQDAQSPHGEQSEGSKLKANPSPQEQLTGTQSGPTAPASQLERLIPKELLDRLEAARSGGSMAGERRIVTLLFCDIKGSTSLAESLDPEEWTEIMNGAFKYLIEPIYRYEGTLARLMGDAILAFFGAPIAHEDDPQRATLAGLEIVESIKTYSEGIKRSYGFDLNVRVGINTGLVVVGEVGSDLRVEYTAMGDAVNIASRMEQTAEPGTVQISGHTYKTIQSLFEVESLGAIELKGKSERIDAYRVFKARAGAAPARGIEGLSSPLVGRDHELAALRSRIDALLAGQGGIISIIGEAGLGKSRLVSELRHGLVARDEPVQWYEGRSFSYETNTPYAPFVDLLGASFGFGEDTSNDVKLAAMDALVGALMPGHEVEFVPFIATMFGIPLSGEYANRVRFLDPMALRARIFRAVSGFLSALAARGPLVLVFDDLHWVDPTSLELVTELLPLTESAPVVLLVLFRPNTQDPSWALHELVARDYGHSYTQLALSPLGESDSRRLVANLLEVEDLPETVRALILAKSEGNPFYVEEVIRSLLDAGLVVREGDHWRATREISTIVVPDTLAGVITARLDRLDPEAQHAAQTAAVIGRDFSYDVLQEVYEAPQALPVAVTTLQRRELVRERSRLPRRTYLFKHVLTQETAYSSLLLSKRRDLHGRVAECLERMEDESASEIARHYLEARKYDRALPYVVEAGERAARAGSRAEATGFFTKAVEIVQTVEELGLARRAYEGLGKAREFSMDPQGSFETYHQMLHYAQDHGDIPMQVSALNKMSFLHALVMGQVPEAESHLAEAESLASANEDADGLYEIYSMRCGMCMMAGDFSKADRYLTQAVELGRKTNRLDTLAYGLAHKSNTLAVMARFDESWDVAQEALSVSEQAGNLQHKSSALGEAVTMYFMSKGELDEAYRRAEEAYQIAERIGSVMDMAIPSCFLTSITAQQGNYELALEWAGRAEQAGRILAGIFPFMLAIPLAGKGLIYQALSPAMPDMAETSLKAAEEAESLMQGPGGAPAGGSVWPDLGFAALARGDVDAAARYFENGLTRPALHMNVQRPRSLCGAALAALALDRTEPTGDDPLSRATQYVAEARLFAREHNMEGSMPLVELTDGLVQEARGNYAEALEHYAGAERLGLRMGMRPIVQQARTAAAGTLTILERLAEADQETAG